MRIKYVFKSLGRVVLYTYGWRVLEGERCLGDDLSIVPKIRLLQLRKIYQLD